MEKRIFDDELQALIKTLPPPPKPRRFSYPRRMPLPHHAALTGILAVLRSGLRRTELTAGTGYGLSVNPSFGKQAATRGVWEWLQCVLRFKLRAADCINVSCVIVDSDSSIHAAGADQKQARTLADLAQRGFGHLLAANANSTALDAILIKANRNDVTQLAPLVPAILSIIGRSGLPLQMRYSKNWPQRYCCMKPHADMQN